ncbi:Small G protein signaling modulator 2 [Schistosoma japonicum]|nr:Small G protein signaling modulator 2 [Schistosoma japonicum]
MIIITIIHNNNNNNNNNNGHFHPPPPPPPQQQQQTWSNISMKNEKKLNFPKFFHSLDSNKIKNYNDNNDKVIKRRTFCSKLSYNSKIAWIHFALIEKLLKTIVQHICSELKECYSSDSIVANECDMNVFLSLISGPCTIHYSSSIHDDSYWYNLHANELVERQRFNLITNHNHIIGRTLQTCAKMKSFLMLPENSQTVNDKNEKLKRIKNSSSLLQSSFSNINVDSLYQTRKSTLLYGKNNVMLGDNHNSLGYLELINSTHNLLLRWTSNNLLLQASDIQFYDYHDHDRNVDQCLLNISMNELDNHKVSDKHRRLQYSLSFKNDNVDDYQLGVITVSMNKVEYVHLHQDTTQEYGLILIDLDGIAHPPIRLQGGFNAVYNFLMCLDQGLQPNA